MAKNLSGSIKSSLRIIGFPKVPLCTFSKLIYFFVKGKINNTIFVSKCPLINFNNFSSRQVWKYLPTLTKGTANNKNGIAPLVGGMEMPAYKGSAYLPDFAKHIIYKQKGYSTVKILFGHLL